MVPLVSGLIGGLVATIAMTVFMMALGDDSPPPTAALWAKYVGDGTPDDYVAPGMVLHLLYGIGAGAVFAIALPVLGYGSAGVATTLGLALAFAVGLALVGMVFWMKVVLALEPEPQQAAMFGAFHLAYGLVLGAFVYSVPLG